MKEFFVAIGVHMPRQESVGSQKQIPGGDTALFQYYCNPVYFFIENVNQRFFFCTRGVSPATNGTKFVRVVLEK